VFELLTTILPLESPPNNLESDADRVTLLENVAAPLDAIVSLGFAPVYKTNEPPVW
jgi:hypothetical protein